MSTLLSSEGRRRRLKKRKRERERKTERETTRDERGDVRPGSLYPDPFAPSLTRRSTSVGRQRESSDISSYNCAHRKYRCESYVANCERMREEIQRQRRSNKKSRHARARASQQMTRKTYATVQTLPFLLCTFQELVARILVLFALLR